MEEIRTLREAVDYLNSSGESMGDVAPKWRVADQKSEAAGATMIPRKRAFTLSEACEYLGETSSRTMDRLVKKGEIDSFLIGRRRFITIENLERFINRKSGWPPNLLD